MEIECPYCFKDNDPYGTGDYSYFELVCCENKAHCPEMCTECGDSLSEREMEFGLCEYHGD